MDETILCPACGQPLPNSSPSGTLKVGDLILNRGTYDVIRAGKDIMLSATEFRVLELLMQRSGQLVSRNEFVHRVWNSRKGVSDNLVHATISQLRRKIDRSHRVKLIKTVRGLGYTIRESTPMNSPIEFSAGQGNKG